MYSFAKINQKDIEESFTRAIDVLLLEIDIRGWDIPNTIKKMTNFLDTGIITYDDYDFLDHIEDASEIFIFKQLSQP